MPARTRWVLTLWAFLIGIAGCTDTGSFDYAFNNDPQGPGLFTGKAGAFVLAVPTRPAERDGKDGETARE